MSEKRWDAQDMRKESENARRLTYYVASDMLCYGAEMLEEDAKIEQIIRDAIQSYNEMFQAAPNDDCERELRERAGLANAWLTAHGFSPEPFHYDSEQSYIKFPRKEEKDGKDDVCRGD